MRGIFHLYSMWKIQTFTYMWKVHKISSFFSESVGHPLEAAELLKQGGMILQYKCLVTLMNSPWHTACYSVFFGLNDKHYFWARVKNILFTLSWKCSELAIASHGAQSLLPQNTAFWICKPVNPSICRKSTTSFQHFFWEQQYMYMQNFTIRISWISFKIMLTVVLLLIF